MNLKGCNAVLQSFVLLRTFFEGYIEGIERVYGKKFL